MAHRIFESIAYASRWVPYSLAGFLCVIILLLIPIPESMRGLQNYLPLHTFLETLSITASGAIFALCLSTLKQRPSNTVRWLAWIFCTVALLDFSHTISYAGMPDFVTPAGPEKAINFWLAARSFAAFGLFVIAIDFLPKRLPSKKYLLPTILLSCVTLLHAVFLFAPHTVPRTFTPEEGLTLFKISFEYILIATYLSTAALLLRPSTHATSGVINTKYLADAAILMAISEYMFTLYASVTDIYNILGHVLKVGAYSLLFRSLFVDLVRRPELALLDMEKERTAIFKALPDAIFKLDPSGNIRAILHNFETSKQKHIPFILNQNVAEQLGSEWVPRFSKAFEKASMSGVCTIDTPYYNMSADPEKTTALTFTISKLANIGFREPGWLLLIRDETEIENHKLTVSRLSSALSKMPVAMAMVDDRWHITYSNNQFFRVFGPNLEGNPEFSNLDIKKVDRALRTGMSISQERTRQVVGTEDTTEMVYFFPLISQDRIYEGAIVFFEDITSRKKAERYVETLLRYDQLTGLPKEGILAERLGHAKQTAIVLRINLDGFGRVNDAYGRVHGDRMLQHIAENLRNELDPTEFLSRDHSDNFTLLALDKSTKQVSQLVQSILQVVRTPFTIGHDTFRMTTCIGVAKYPDDGTTFDELCNSADSALRVAKLEGPGHWASFSTSLKNEVSRFMAIAAHLSQAIKKEEFSLAFQPQMTVDGTLCCGSEVLLRWHSDELGCVSPEEFIPIAENTQNIKTIGAWVFKETVKTAQRLKAKGQSFPKFSINLSPAEFEDLKTVDQFFQIATEAGIDPSWIELELTEHMLIKDSQAALATINYFRDKGFGIALDDFGAGQTSLRYLVQFPVQILKIDKSLIDNIASDARNASIVENIIDLAHRLDMHVIAEGVESVEQQKTLIEVKCDEIQGFLFSKPLSEADYVDFLEKTPSRIHRDTFDLDNSRH